MFFLFDFKENITLDDLRWKNRIVLHFPSKDQNSEVDFNDLNANLIERKIIFLSIGNKLLTNSKDTFYQDYLKSIREKYGSKSGQGNWVLIGLDGGIKLNKEGDPDWDLIFKTIDSMPMRQSEIKNGIIPKSELVNQPKIP
jgi:hypothetical protein